MKGLIGKKVGMTSIFDASGASIAVTVVEFTPNVVTQVKTADGNDGYNAIQLGSGERKLKNTPKPLQGHFAAANTTPKKKVMEFRNCTIDAAAGTELRVEDVFADGDKVSAIGNSRGKGTQGVVKRHGFAGVGQATHGQHNRLRAPGSVGASSYPSRVFKGMRMGGHDGNRRVKTTNLVVVKVMPEKNIMLIKGAIPGHKGATVIIEKR